MRDNLFALKEIALAFRFKIDRRSSESLVRQIYDQVRNGVLSGALAAGHKLPSSRDLSEDLQISRPTVSLSFKQLEREGYIEIRHGAGVFIRALDSNSNDPPEKSKPKNSRVRLSQYAKVIQRKLGESVVEENQPDEISQSEIGFYCWRPALDQFPSTEWARILGREARHIDVRQMDQVGPAHGALNLRKQIAKLVFEFRQVQCDPEQVILTMGLNQALDLVSRIHLENGCTGVVEEPGYYFARYFFQANGAQILPGIMDSEGLRVDSLLKKAEHDIRLVYLTPSHQFPTGITMSLTRRLEILSWANEQNVVILEDDYDSEYQSVGKPIPALMSLDTKQKVIYAGTMNQLMFPALGLGYLIVPPHLINVYQSARKMAGDQMPMHVQNAIAQFIEEGHLQIHLRKLTALYSVRRKKLIESLATHFGDKVKMTGASTTGVFLTANFESDRSSDEILIRAKANGVGLTSSAHFYQSKSNQTSFILGFGSLTEEEIEEGVRRLKQSVG